MALACASVFGIPASADEASHGYAASHSLPDSLPGPMATIAEEFGGLWQAARLSFNNPAVNQWRLHGSVTRAGGSYASRSDHGCYDPRNGSGEHEWRPGATTYTRYKSSTLWGNASYSNGRIRALRWNETADTQLLYPYLLADSVGGDMSQEQYSFGGGYADHNGRWAWGASLSYVATLQFRDVDPRPRNVVGKLDASAGIMYRIFSDYYTGISLDFRKYKQNNDIEFKSEMGVDKIFHLTGLGSHYDRFGGTGYSTYYDGYRYGADINLYPSGGRGFFGTLSLSRFTFKNIISDLNKLPLASAWHNELTLQAGWMASGARMDGAVTGNLTVYRRHGTENVFGDASSAVYPVIGENVMYADNMTSAGASLRWGMRFGSVTQFHIEINPQWKRRTTAYIEPYSYRVVNCAAVEAAAQGSLRAGRHWLLNLRASFEARRPYDSVLSLQTGDRETAGLLDAERRAYDIMSSRSDHFGISFGMTRFFGSRYGAELSGSFRRSVWHGVMRRNLCDLSLMFIF